MRLPKHPIRPSRDFTARTLAQIMMARQRRQFVLDLTLPLLAFSPLILRQLWLWLGYHHNYFKPGRWPVVGHFATQTYWLFLSNLVAYTLLALGSGLVVWQLLRSHRLQLLGRVFSQLWHFDWRHS